MGKTAFPALSAAELTEAGQALFGPHWRQEMALALGLDDDALIGEVESGRLPAPPEWRAQLVAIAQDCALRAMEVASTLLWQDGGSSSRSESDAPLRAAQLA